MTIFDDSASFLSLPVSERLKKAQTEKALGEAKIARTEKSENRIKSTELLYNYCFDYGVGILTDSCLELNVFAFSAFAFARDVRLYGDVTIFDASASFFISPRSMRRLIILLHAVIPILLYE